MIVLFRIVLKSGLLLYRAPLFINRDGLVFFSSHLLLLVADRDFFLKKNGVIDVFLKKNSRALFAVHEMKKS